MEECSASGRPFLMGAMHVQRRRVLRQQSWLVYGVPQASMLRAVGTPPTVIDIVKRYTNSMSLIVSQRVAQQVK